MVVSGCGGEAPDPERLIGGTNASDTADAAIIRDAADEREPMPAAIIRGTLSIGGPCLLVGEAVALFPVGTQWDGETLTLPDGKELQPGDNLSGGGGSFPVSGDFPDAVSPENGQRITECADANIVTEWVLINPPDSADQKP